MSKQKGNLGYLGQNFQIKLINQIIVDEKFGNSVIDAILPTYFDNEYLRLIAAEIKNYYEKYGAIPQLVTIEEIVKSTISKDITRDMVLETIKEINEADQKDFLWIQEESTDFFTQQELKKVNKKIDKIIESGDSTKYPECLELIKHALSIGEHRDNGIDIFNQLDDVLSEDFRHPIPTGISGLDEAMGGGLSKGELGVILAGFGTGKSTMVTKLANHAYNLGYHVIQIFFEDKPKVIQRKHLSCWTGIELNDLSLHKDKVMNVVTKMKNDSEGSLTLKKFPSDGTTIPQIATYLRNMMANGIRPDLVLLDYIDCISPSKVVDDINVSEGTIMRQFESMIDELNVAGWTCIQGNRSSLNAQLVESNMIGGSIKRGQIGHFILSVAKTLEQKEDGRATVAILKSRFSKDGIIFEDIIFDNAKVHIDMTNNSNVTFLEFNKGKDKRRSETIVEALKQREILMGGKK